MQIERHGLKVNNELRSSKIQNEIKVESCGNFRISLILLLIIETGGKTPTMAVDDSDLDITLKTPPMVRKVKSRPTSAATPQGSSKLSEASISKKLMKRKLAMKVEEAKEDEPQVQADSMNKSINKIKMKEKPIKGSPNSKKLLTPQIKAGSGIISKSPKSAKKNSMKSRRRSEPIK